MTFNELMRLFEAYTGTEGEVEEAQLAMWMNEAQLDLAYELGTVVNWTPTDFADSPIPDDCLRIIDSSASYEITPDNHIHFPAGSAKVYYFKTPVPFDGVNQDQQSELNPALHTLLAMFAASRYWDKESEGDYEESGHANKWMGYYLQGKTNARNKLQVSTVQIDRWRVV